MRDSINFAITISVAVTSIFQADDPHLFDIVISDRSVIAESILIK